MALGEGWHGEGVSAEGRVALGPSATALNPRSDVGKCVIAKCHSGHPKLDVDEALRCTRATHSRASRVRSLRTEFGG